MRFLRRLLAPVRQWLPGWLVRRVFWHRSVMRFTDAEWRAMLRDWLDRR